MAETWQGETVSESSDTVSLASFNSADWSLMPTST